MIPSILMRVSPRAFSLIELLVGITIGALLVGLGVPALKGAITKAHQVQCSSNMRQIGQGLLLYSGENQGRLPGTAHAGTSFWIEELKPYLGEKYDRVRISPCDLKKAERLKNGGTSYVMNGRVNPEAFANEFGEIDSSEVVHDNLLRMASPSRVILLFIVSTNKIGTVASEDHVCGDIATWSGLRQEVRPDAYGGGAVDGSHGRANYLFADGRVEAIPSLRMKQVVEGGTDISKYYP